MPTPRRLLAAAGLGTRLYAVGGYNDTTGFLSTLEVYDTTTDAWTTKTPMPTLARALFPDPPRRVPAHRGISIALRTAHLTTFGILLGGHVFGVEHARLLPFLYWTVATGAALMALEMASTCAWLFMGKGAAVVAKLLMLSLVQLFWEQRVPILLLVVVIASVGAHMPSRFRHQALFPVWPSGRRGPVAANEVRPLLRLAGRGGRRGAPPP